MASASASRINSLIQPAVKGISTLRLLSSSRSHRCPIPRVRTNERLRESISVMVLSPVTLVREDSDATRSLSYVDYTASPLLHSLHALCQWFRTYSIIAVSYFGCSGEFDVCACASGFRAVTCFGWRGSESFVQAPLAGRARSVQPGRRVHGAAAADRSARCSARRARAPAYR